MKSNISKHYNKLTYEERIDLIFKAAARGDRAEIDRIIAPVILQADTTTTDPGVKGSGKNDIPIGDFQAQFMALSEDVQERFNAAKETIYDVFETINQNRNRQREARGEY